MNSVDFTIKLSGSKLFDLYTLATAKKLVEKFPGLKYEFNDDEVRIFGELNDYWYDKYNEAVFNIGSID